jgi:ribosomal protein L37E
MYTNICPNCGKKSEQELKDCPYCGFTKAEIVNKNSITKSINDSLVDKLSFLDYPQLYVTIIFRLVFILIAIFLIPDFISNSEFFWMVIGIFSVYGLIKEVAKSYSQFRIVYKTSKLLMFAFFGAGFGNLISHAGRMVYFRFSYYFNLEFLYEQIELGNSMILLGTAAGIGFMLITNSFYDEFKVKDYISENEL